MEKNEILNIIKELNTNAMFAMSQTSKELFHSNFWAWLLRKYPDIFTSVFYKDYNGTDKPKISREYKHTDLWIEFTDKIIVIENKFKSMPDEEQLKKYDKNIHEKNKKIILISYFKPFLRNLHSENTFEYISYNALCKLMKECFEKNNNFLEKHDKVIIQCYIEFLDLLNKLQNTVDFSDNNKIKDLQNVIHDKEIQTELKKINFQKTFERIFTVKLAEKGFKRF